VPRKSGALFTHVRKGGTCAGMNCVYYRPSRYCPSRWNHLLTAAHSQAVLVSVVAFGGPSSEERLATDRRCACCSKITCLRRCANECHVAARKPWGHRPHLGCWDLEDLLAILSSCRREIARSHCCPDKKHTHAAVAHSPGSELREGARKEFLRHAIPVML
jgi:hypothetical protein